MAEPAVTSPRHHGGRSHGSNGTPVCLVFHDEEYPLRDTSAEAIARMFASPKSGGCAQYVIDADSEQHPVAELELSWNAPPNTGTIGFERDGYASWSLKEWRAPKAQMTTCRVAARAAEVAARRRIPVTWLEIADLKRLGRMARGCTSHNNRSKAFGLSTHTDPGPHFPIAEFMALVRRAYSWFRDHDAIVAFQQANRLTPDGVVGPATIGKAASILYRDGGAPARPAPKPKPHPSKPDQPSWHPEAKRGTLTIWMHGARTRKVQARLGIKVDGYFGQDTRAAVIQYQRAHGIKVTGSVDTRTWARMFPAKRKPSRSKAFPTLAVDGIAGPNTIKALASICGSRSKSLDLALRKAVQRHLRVAADGVWGNITIRALQAHVHAHVDGALGPETWRHVQDALKHGRF